VEDNIPKVINSPCCVWHRAYVYSEVLPLLEKVGKSAKAMYGWRYTIRAFPPFWQLYISEDDLSPEALTQMQMQAGPTVVLQELLERG